MGIFFNVRIVGFEGRQLVSRNESHDQERPGQYDWKTQRHIDIGDPLDPERYAEGDEIQLEDWSNDSDCLFRIVDGRWKEVSRQAWCWPELTYNL